MRQSLEFYRRFNDATLNNIYIIIIHFVFNTYLILFEAKLKLKYNFAVF